MSVSSVSSDYENMKDKWNKISTVLEGEESIKEAGTEYLPMLTGQDSVEYEAYKERGAFFNATARTLQGLTGAVMRRDPVVSLPKRMEGFLDDVTMSGLSFIGFTRKCINEVLGYGYCGVYVDMSRQNTETPRPYFAFYSAIDILNYRFKKTDEGYELVLLCLKEKDAEEGPDEFTYVEREQIRVARIENEEGLKYLSVEVYQKTGEKEDEWTMVEGPIIPEILGERLDYIPFVFFGALGNVPKPPKPPLLDLVNLNIKHWQLSVDYYHGLHWCAVPTPWVSGVDQEKEIFLGAQKALIIPNENGKAGMLEFTGQGMGAVEKGLDRVEAQMAVVGARLLEERKKAAEAAETLRIRASDDAATLSTIVGSIEGGFNQAFRFMALWVAMKDVEEEIETHLNRDFVSERLSANDIVALLKSWQSGGMSLDTFLYNLLAGEILPKGRTVEEEKELIQAEETSGGEFEGLTMEEEEEEEEVVEE